MSSKLSSIHSDDDDDLTPEPTFRSSATTTNKSQEGTSTGRRDEAELEEFTKLLSEQMKLNKLQGAIRVYDREMLRSAIKDYDRAEAAEAGDGAHEEDEYEAGSGIVTSRKGTASDELKKARHLLELIDSHYDALRDACEARDRKAILDSLDNIRSSRVDRFLRGPMKGALELADALETRELRMPILAMDKKTMSEIRSYAKPSPLVHRVMQAALLLLGEDEGTTEAWSKVQSCCCAEGPKGMNRRLMTFSADNLHEFIVERAFYLLKNIKLTDVQRASPGAATFFVWAMGVLKERGCQWDDQKTNDEQTKTPGQKAPNKVNLDQIIKKEVEIFAEAQRKSNEKRATKPSPKNSNVRMLYL